jgi:ADP-heptose:LPS heptosyltransferase
VDAANPAGYDLFVNLDDAYENNPDVHYVDNYFYRVFGDRDCNKSVELFPSDEDKAAVDRDLADIGDKFVVIHMRNWHWAAKNISMNVWFEVFAQVFEERTDFKFVCVGGETDFVVEEHPLFVDARTVYNEQQIKYLCDHARAFVGIDSAPYWSAAASDTHIIALLTHLQPEVIIPFRKRELGHNSTAIQTLEDCKGCNSKQATPVRQIVCAKNTYPCVNNFDVGAIAKAIIQQLQ